MTTSITTQLTFAVHRVEYLRAELLRDHGWRYSCNNPAALWLWVKEIDGVQYAVSADTALLFEEKTS